MMTVEFEFMLQLLKSSIYGEMPPNPTEKIDWSALYSGVMEHQISPIVFNAVKGLPEEFGPPKDILDLWKSSALAQGFIQMRKMAQLRAIVKSADEKNVKMAVIKGAVLSNLYPSSYSRICADADILIAGEDEARAHDLLLELKYSPSEEDLSDYEHTYKNEILNVELHTRLWEEKAGEQYDRLEALGISMENLAPIDVEGYTARTIAPQNMLIYLFYHMIKHFFLCGIGVRYLSDMTLFVRRYSEEVSWDTFWSQAKELGYASFCRSFLYLCIKYIGLSEELVKGINISDADRNAAHKMLEDILEGGHAGRSTVIRTKAGRIMQLYYNKPSEEMPKSKLQMIFQLFSYKSWEIDEQRTMQYEYSRLKLFAWIQFMFIWVIGKIKNRYSLRERMKCVDNRVDMLRDLNLIE